MSNIMHAHSALADALAKKGYSTLTPVQDAVLEPELLGQDLLVSAQTGSGKTVAFGLAMAPTLLDDSDAFLRADAPLALAIAPTRELALQVKRELDWLYREAGAKTASCVGGMDMRDERRALARGAHIVVGTPGRLCDHIKRGSLDMSELKAIVLDEADEMLKMGFREELEQILGAAPEERRTLMFSATVPKTILGMTRKYQHDAVRVNTAAEAKQHLDIEYRAMSVANSDKENAIINVLRYYNAKNAIVFGDTRIAVNRMTQRFNNRGFSVVALSGELSQKERSNALQAMRDGRAQVCIATDVAARGLDLPDLELVIHADVPKNREALLHRSGRTGRAGRKGVSVLIVTPKRRRNAERLLRDANITAEWSGPPSAEDIIQRDNERLLGDMTLEAEVSEEERTMVARLLKAYSAEHIATAFIRQYRAGQSAPEELTHSAYDPSQDDRSSRKPSSCNDFSGGVWFSLNLGRKQKAEPKWIMPMLMKSGGLKKPEIGAIKITETQTFIEVAPAGVDRFMETIGPDMKIEKAITATRLNGQPDFNSKLPTYKTRDNNKNRGNSKDKNYRDKGDKKRSFKESAPKKSTYDEGSFKRKQRTKTSDDAPAFDDPFMNDAPKKKTKKPHKKKLARAAALKAKGQGGVKKGARKNTRKKDRR
ncbi:DEAD/DEAH box helicase [Hellea balneolensis]|uniref:DEAD/DEAH box helicase n=1 Tax=Hellea balneolensis TaxID=287478 RepID=UPI0003F8B954|nr:DEAD/DEAH box helicase [Hellea balneolensis]